MRPAGRWLPPALLVLVVAAGGLAAQEIPHFPSAAPDTAPNEPSWQPDSPAQKPWVRPLASLLVPGTGQLAAGQSRGLVYLAMEVWLVSRVIAYDRRGDEQAARYRQLAYDVARRQFMPTEVNGPFEYFETMEKFVESGVFDADPGAGFVPEPDTSTFNGSVWRLAQRTFFPDPTLPPAPGTPQYDAAVSFYQSRAIPDSYRWSWRGARLEQDVYRGSIKAADDAFRSRTNYLGALVLNHLASAVDALVSSRAGRRAVLVPRAGFQSNPAAASLVWTGTFRSP